MNSKLYVYCTVQYHTGWCVTDSRPTRNKFMWPMPPEWWNASAESFTVVAPHASRFILSGMPQSFASHVPKEFPADAAVLEESVRHASQINLEGNRLQQQQWNRVAQIVAKRRQLRVAVLGCSTSVGCGSADPLSKCDASRGWPRLFHDELQNDLREQLPGWKYSTQTRVTAKNAVDPTYFARAQLRLLTRARIL